MIFKILIDPHFKYCEDYTNQIGIMARAKLTIARRRAIKLTFNIAALAKNQLVYALIDSIHIHKQEYIQSLRKLINKINRKTDKNRTKSE